MIDGKVWTLKVNTTQQSLRLTNERLFKNIQKDEYFLKYKMDAINGGLEIYYRVRHIKPDFF